MFPRHSPPPGPGQRRTGHAREASRRDHQPYQVRHLDEIEWETIRWPGETGKMLFHPKPQSPTEPNAGILGLEPAYHPSALPVSGQGIVARLINEIEGTPLCSTPSFAITDEDFIGSWTKEQDDAVMGKLAVVQDKLTKPGAGSARWPGCCRPRQPPRCARKTRRW